MSSSRSWTSATGRSFADETAGAEETYWLQEPGTSRRWPRGPCQESWGLAWRARRICSVSSPTGLGYFMAWLARRLGLVVGVGIAASVVIWWPGMAQGPFRSSVPSRLVSYFGALGQQLAGRDTGVHESGVIASPRRPVGY